MSERNESNVNPGATKSARDGRQDPLDPAAHVPSEVPAGFDRRKFLIGMEW